jgi:WD40 repeat protein
MVGPILAWLAVAFLAVAAAAEEPRTDEHGDPLPDGALRRIGTIRYRAGASINYAALSPDGKYIAAASEIGLTIIEMDTGKPRHIPTAEAPNGFSPGRVCVAFSPDSKELFSVTNGGNLRVWDPATGKMLRQLGTRPEPRPGPGQMQPLGAPSAWGRVWFPRQGKQLICATIGGNAVARLDPDSGQASVPVPITGELVGTNSDGSTLVLADSKQAASLIDVKGQPIRRFDHAASLAALCAGNKLLVTAANGWEIRVWDVASGRQLHSFTGQNPGASFVDISYVATTLDGKTLFAGTQRGDILRWDLETGKAMAPLTGHCNFVTGLFFPPGGKVLVSVSWDSLIRRWDLTTGKELPSPQGLTGHLFVARRPDGRVAALGDDNGRLEFRDLVSGGAPVILREAGPPVSKLCFSPDGKRLAVAQRNGIVNFWTGDAREPLELKVAEPPRAHGTVFEAMAFSPDGRWLVTSVFPGGTTLWDSTTGKQQWLFGPVAHFAFSPDGRTVAMALGRTLDFVDATDGSVKKSVPAGWLTAPRLAFSPDGSILAVCHYDGTIALRDGPSGLDRKVLKGHGPVALSASFSANGKWLASSRDKSIRLWEVATGAELLRLDGHVYHAWSAEISPDGRTILSSSWDLTALLWSTRPRPDGKPKRVLDALWDDLAGEPVAAWRAQWALADDAANGGPIPAPQDRPGGRADRREAAGEVARRARQRQLPRARGGRTRPDRDGQADRGGPAPGPGCGEDGRVAAAPPRASRRATPRADAGGAAPVAGRARAGARRHA